MSDKKQIKEKPKSIRIDDLVLDHMANYRLQHPVKKIDKLYSPRSIDKNGKLTNDSDFMPYIDNLGINDVLIYENAFPGYATLSYYLQDGIINQVCSTLAQECIRKGFKFIPLDTEEDKSEKIAQLEKEFLRLDVKNVLQRGLFNTFAFGGCMLYPKLVGDEGELSKELLIDASKIGIGSLLDIRIIEPLYCNPIYWNSNNPLEKDFYEPTTYNIYSTMIHESRMIKMIHNIAPTLLRPMYHFFGIPLTMFILPYVKSFREVMEAKDDIIKRYNLNVLKSNMNALQNDYGPNGLSQRAALFNLTRDNRGLLMIEKETEEFEQITMTLAGLDGLVSQAAELVCATAKIPSTKLWGTSPKGFNATGESDMRNYYDNVSTIQENVLRPVFNKLLKIVMLNKWGYEDSTIGFEFNPLWDANELEISQIQLNKANADAININNGSITWQEARKRLAKDPDSGYDNLMMANESFENEEEDVEQEETNTIEEPIQRLAAR